MSVHREQVARVGVVTIVRPGRRNAVDRPTAEALRAAIDDFDAAPDIDVIVLTGADGTFCAGADLTAFDDADRRNALTPDLRGPMGPTRRHPGVPVIAAVEGHAVAGGFELALWADLRVVARDAVFGVSCRRVGVPLIDGGTVRLPRIVGLGVALDLILTGRDVGADEAQRIGLATLVVESGTARAEALVLAERLAAFPQQTLRADLRAARAAFDTPLDDALLAEHRGGVTALEQGGADVGVQAFVSGAGRHGAPIDLAP